MLLYFCIFVQPLFPLVTMFNIDNPDVFQSNNCSTQASSRSLGSSSTDSSQGSQSTASSRKSSNSSSLSTDSSSASAKAEISRGALEEIAAFERFIEDYFDLACDNNNLVQMEKMKAPLQGRISASSSLSEVLELSI